MNYTSIEIWKTRLKTAILIKTWQNHICTMNLYSSLDLYKTVIKQRLSPWYVHECKNPKSKTRCVLMIRLLTNVEKLDESHYCSTCNVDLPCTIAHVLFECSALATVRNIQWTAFCTKVPLPFVTSITSISIVERPKLFLCAFESTYIEEMYEIYEAVSYFTLKMVRAKQIV